MHMRTAQVVAICRAKNSEASFNRCLELDAMGCKAIEITMDSANAMPNLRKLTKLVSSNCMLGVGTVFYDWQVCHLYFSSSYYHFFS